MDIIQEKSRKEKLVQYGIGFVIVFYLGVLCGAAWLPGISIEEWFENFYQFIIVEGHYIVGFTDATISFVLVFEGIWTIAYLYYETKIKHPWRGREYGDAKWGEAKAFTKKYGNHDEKHLVKVNFGDMPEPENPVYVNTHNYWLAEDVYLSIDNELTSNLNIEIIGPPGTGKSFRIVRPILSQLAGNFLVTDPKGELSQQSGQYMEDNGYGVFIINCQSEEGMLNSHRFNPFKYIEYESDILGLCEILFKSTSNPDAASGDQFFEDMAQVLLSCIFYLMIYTYPEDKKDWKNFVELLNSTAVKANPKTGAIDLSDPNCFMNRYTRANNEWKEKHNGEELKGFRDVEKIYTGAQETSSSIVSSLDAHCKYMKLDCVIDLLSEDDLDFIQTFGYANTSKISSTGKYILYLVTSENIRYFDWIPSMIYSLFITGLYHITETDESLHQSLPHHLTFLMDEFANVTLPDSFVGLTSTMRSRNISVMPIVQNLQQYKEKFPKNDADKNLRSNMSACVILGGPDMESCETLSKEFLKETINKQTTGLTHGSQGSSSENEDVMEHALLPPDKIFGMDKNGPCAIRVKGAKPLWQPKVQFQNSPLKPLLTRKKNYKVKKNDKIVPKLEYDRTKSACDQFPEVLMGDDAIQFEKRCIEENIPIVTITEMDLNALTVLDMHHEKIPGKDPTTKIFWEMLYQNTARVMDEAKRNELDLDSFSDKQILVVQKLRNKGFTPAQINSLSSLILIDYSFDEIISFFNCSMTTNEIKEFAIRLSQLENMNE